MPELLISEITRMKERVCVIGLEQTSSGFHSLRPVPTSGFGWRDFPHRRADRVVFDLHAMPVTKPHLEDRLCSNHRKLGTTSEDEMLDCLKKAEIGDSRTDLFGCAVHSTQSGAAYVEPGQGGRSICGCRIKNIRFDFADYPQKKNIRAALLLASGDRLDNLPVVDRDWLRFADQLWAQKEGEANLQQRSQRYFNRQLGEKHILSSEAPFVRVGLSRPFFNRCWLMLDSIFPLPKDDWLKELE